MISNNLKLGDEAIKDLGLTDQHTTKDIDKYINDHLFDISKKPDPQTFLLYHNGVPLAGRGNLISISGAAKSRKSVIASGIIGSFIGNNENVLGFHSKINSDDLVMHMDTEQAYFHYYNMVTRTYSMGGIDKTPSHFKSIRTRDAGSSHQRIDIMKRLFQLYKPTVFVLDGVTDLMDDINSNEESTNLINTLLALSDNYNALIVNVIHETATNNKMRGAIGTSLMNKVECAISVVLDQNEPIASHVSCKDSRNKKFEPFTIVQDGPKGEVRLAEEGEVEKIEGNNKRGGKDKFKPNVIDEDTHFKMITSLGNFKGRYKKTEIEQTIKNYSFGIYGQEIKITEAKETLKYFLSRSWVVNNTENELLIPSQGDDLPF